MTIVHDEAGLRMEGDSAWSRPSGIPNTWFNDDWPDVDYWIYLRGTIAEVHEDRLWSEFYETPRVQSFQLEGVLVRCNIHGNSEPAWGPLEAGDEVVILGERQQQDGLRYCRANWVQVTNRRRLYIANKGNFMSLYDETPEGDAMPRIWATILFLGFLAYTGVPRWVLLCIGLLMLASVLRAETVRARKAPATELPDWVKEAFLKHEFTGIGAVEKVDGQIALFAYLPEEASKAPATPPMMLRLASLSR